LRRTPSFALAALMVATLAVSCGGSSSSSAPGAAPTTNLSVARATTSTAQVTAPSSDSPELLARTLEPQDIGAGWATVDDDNSLCDDADKIPQRTGCADAGYQNASTGEEVREMIGSYAPQGAAAIVRGARLTYGNAGAWQLMATPIGGDESIAAKSRLNVSTNFELLIRSRDLLIFVTYRAPSGLAVQQALDLQSVIQRAVNKAH
jgi:hypothetical protein